MVAKHQPPSSFYISVERVPPFSFEISTEGFDDHEVVRFVGELDLEASSLLEEALILWGRTEQTVVVDLSELDYIDSNGYGALVRAQRKLEATGGALFVRGPLKSGVSQVFDVLGVLSSNEGVSHPEPPPPPF